MYVHRSSFCQILILILDWQNCQIFHIIEESNLLPNSVIWNLSISSFLRFFRWKLIVFVKNFPFLPAVFITMSSTSNTLRYFGKVSMILFLFTKLFSWSFSLDQLISVACIKRLSTIKKGNNQYLSFCDFLCNPRIWIRYSI